MNIYLLEDEILQQQRLAGMIKDICGIEGITYLNLHATSRPVDVLSSLKNASLHNLYFLDLEIDDEEQKGFAVAKEIRKSDPQGTIVFVTTHSELAIKTFEYHIGAVDFIDKSLGQGAFRQRVQNCLLLASSRARATLPTDTFRFESGQINYQVPFGELLYVETTSTPHKLRLVSTTRVMEFYGDLKEIESLDPRLFRTHRAYVVNLKAIQEIDRKEKKVLLAGGSECLVSRRLLKTLLEKWKE